MSADRNRRFAFEGFVLDCSAGELRRAETAIDLRPKVYELLEFLVRHAGQLVSKEELLDAVWDDTNVSDGTLNRTVAELRHMLQDDPREPRLVETVARRGYRFIAPVTESSTPPSELSEFALIFPDRVVPLRRGATTLGRTPECDVQIIAPSVSRRHARILVTSEGATIEDLGSTNGTFVGDDRVSSVTSVDDGADIRLGKERLRLISDRAIRARTEPAL